MDKIKFTLIVQWINTCLRSKDYFEGNELAKLDEMIMDAQKPQISCDMIDGLLAHIAGGRKIEAIKAYRSITGAGLKESKDAVEANWKRQTSPVATLGDILHNATGGK